MDLDIVQVPPRIASNFKEEVIPFIQRALDRVPPKWRAEDIFQDILSEKVQLFVAIDIDAKIQAVCTTQVDQYPLAKVLTVLQLASEVPMDELWKLFHAMQEWALKEVGCDYIEIYGRKGWQKLLSSEGYSLASVHLIKSGD